jgi:hypothetical protein
MMPRRRTRDDVAAEIAKWERELVAATDTGLRRWIEYHLTLLRLQQRSDDNP